MICAKMSGKDEANLGTLWFLTACYIHKMALQYSAVKAAMCHVWL